MLKGTCSPDDKEQLSEIYFSEGLLYERLHEYNSMFSALKQALTFNPNHDQALNRIWLCIEMSRNFEESIELCKQIIDNEPYCYMAWYNLGHAHTYFGNYEKAIEAYEYAFITNEEFEWAYRHCAELCMEIQNYSKALDCYEELLSHIQPDGELLFKIGQCYHFLGKTKIAQQFYKRSIKLDDINDEVYFYLGECAIQLNDWNRAIYYYKRAIEIEGKREEYYAALGKAYAFLDSFEKAFICFDRAIQLAPEQTVYWIEFADFLIGINAIDTALDVLKDAAEQAVGAEILYCKAACLFKINQRKNAMKVLEEALIEDFELHSLIFEYNPKLKNDKDIIAMLEFYKYES
jgi:tetratricopeptide (TPR) repeat protein